MSSEYYRYNLNFRNFFMTPESIYENREIVYFDKRITFKEFFREARALCSGLAGIGVKQGDVVGVIDWDTLTYMKLYYAIPMIGAVMHTVNIRYPQELIYLTMAHAGDKYVVVRDEFVPVLEKYATMFDFVKGWIVYSDSGSAVSSTLSPLYQLSDLEKGGECEPPDLDENTWATVFYTSGTTGLPKGVTFKQRDLVLHTLALLSVMKNEPLSLTSDDVFMSLVPMFHVHSWGMPYVAVANGNKYVLPGRYDFGKILELIEREKVTFSTMVPSILYMLLTHPKAQEHAGALKGLKVIVGGAALPKGLAMMARGFGMTVVGGYGLSETCPVLTISVLNDYTKKLSPEEQLDYLISTGLPIPMVQLKTVGPDGKEVAKDGKSVGEIVVRAPWLTEGYFKDPEKTKELWAGGWLHTGDLATVDVYGYVHIVDREKDAVKSGGEFIPTLVLENLISEVNGVAEVAVVGRPDPKWGERPVAFVVKKGEVTEEDIIKHLEGYISVGRIQKWWIPEQVIFIDSMPRTSTNKIDKKELRARLQGS